MDPFERLDWATYYFFRFQANRAPFLHDVITLGDWLGGYAAIALVTAVAVAVALVGSRWRLAGAIVMALVFGVLLVEGTRLATQRPRPPDAQNFLPGAAASPGFPSRGVFLAAVAWLLLAVALERPSWRRGKRVGVYAGAALLIVCVCLSQLLLGLHFLTDVLAGLAGGVGLALLARAVAPGGAYPDRVSAAKAS
jgi:undecaprenyl-diphosphatase